MSQDAARVEIHRRRGDIGWELAEYAGPEAVEFTAPSLTPGMREIYDGVPIAALAHEPSGPPANRQPEYFIGLPQLVGCGAIRGELSWRDCELLIPDEIFGLAVS